MLLWAILIAVLATVAWQDFRHRAVYAWLFPLLAALVVTHTIVMDVFSFTSIVINIAIIAVQLGVLNLLMYMRTKKWLMHGEQWIGWGDIAFFGVLACCFSTVNFVVFYVISLIIVLFGALATMAFGRFAAHIPLAGGQAVLLMLVLLLDYGHWGMRLYDDINVIPFIH